MGAKEKIKKDVQTEARTGQEQLRGHNFKIASFVSDKIISV